MLAWITHNAANITLSALLVYLVARIVRKLIRDRKNGIGPCSNCAQCPHKCKRPED